MPHSGKDNGLVIATLFGCEPLHLLETGRCQCGREFIAEQTAIFSCKVKRGPLHAGLHRDVDVNRVPLVIDPVPDLMNDPPRPTISVESRSLNRRSSKDEVVVVPDTRHEQSACFKL